MLCAVTERINGLCDLGRFADASLLLLDHASDFEASEDPHAGAGVRWLEGRIALGQKDYRHAEDLFASSRDALLALGRNHDAALVSLYLAEVLLAQGRTRDLRRLAAQLTARFRSSELPVETLKSLRLFARAVAADTLTVALLATLRRDLDSTVPPAFPKRS